MDYSTLNKDSKPFAVETWWHRLLQVLVYSIPILVGITLASIASEAVYITYDYSYSFENRYSNVDGEVKPCRVFKIKQHQMIICGELTSGEEFVDYYESVRGPDHHDLFEKYKDLLLRVGDAAPFTGPVMSLDSLAEIIITEYAVSYKAIKNTDYEKLVIVILGIIGSVLVCYAVLLLLYKLILFIVHGHTRIRRTST